MAADPQRRRGPSDTDRSLLLRLSVLQALARDATEAKARDTLTVIPERGAGGELVTFHLPVGVFDPDVALSVGTACGATIGFPHREQHHPSKVCPACLAAPEQPFTVVGE